MAKALIFAGGSGLRMNSKSKPKQFLEMNGKPVLIHTIEHFENHPEIDGIVVVCIKDWMAYLKDTLRKYNINKVYWVIEGGETAFESIYKGLDMLRRHCLDDEIILIHDGVRPLITREVITKNIRTAKEFGTAITVDYARETVVQSSEDKKIKDVYPRDALRIAKAPQTFLMKSIYDEYKTAILNKETYIDSATLMQERGYDLHLVYSSEYNIKITTASDFYIFRAILEALENSQIFGLDS